MAKQHQVTLFALSMNGGGIETLFARLAKGCLDAGDNVEMLFARKGGILEHEIAPEIKRAYLSDHFYLRKILIPFVRHLRATRPEVLLSGHFGTNSLSIIGKRLARVNTKVKIGIHLALPEAVEYGLIMKRDIMSVKLLDRFADGIHVHVPEAIPGYAKFAGVDPARIAILPNMSLTDEVLAHMDDAIEDPYFDDPTVPVILACGRLSKQKDFGTLIRAIKIVDSQKKVKLVILGTGPDEGELKALIEELGLTESVILAGVRQYPVRYMKRAAMFVMSSIVELSPAVLTEALVAAPRIVSTACKTGPRDLLDDGKWGKLVAPQNPEALAQAILDSLAEPPSVRPREAWEMYTPEKAMPLYREFLYGK